MKKLKRVYLDYNATAPCRPEAVAALSETASRMWGNPSSAHSEGRLAKAVLEDAREALASALGARSKEVFFTSGGTEANNLVIHGVVGMAAVDKPHIVTSAIEHPAVLNVCRGLEAQGVDVSFVGCDRKGCVDAQAVASAINERTVLISLMHANNEVGTIQPVRAVTEMAHARDILVHTDAVQSFGKIPVMADALGVDFLSVSGHKIGAPKGVGALYVRESAKERLSAVFLGGPQEGYRRPGTENVPGIAAFSAAVKSAMDAVEAESVRLRILRDRLLSGLRAAIPSVALNGDLENGLPNTLNVSFPEVAGEDLMMALDLDGVAVSTGSACAVGARKPSHVLKAMRVGSDRMCGPLRFSLGYGTSGQEVDLALETVLRVMDQLRKAGKVCACHCQC